MCVCVWGGGEVVSGFQVINLSNPTPPKASTNSEWSHYNIEKRKKIINIVTENFHISGNSLGKVVEGLCILPLVDLH